jgi:hypothetical protein
MSLATAQALFWRALQGEKIDPDLFVGTQDLPAAERVGIYTEMILARLIEALRADFPETAAAFGEEAFDRLAREFVRSQPSKHSDLGRLGADFPAFCPPGARGLAELEWARTEVFVEADERALTPEEFQQRVDPQGFAEQHLRILQALRLVDATAVWRTGFDVLETVLPAAEARALRLAAGGGSVGEICGVFEDPQTAFTAIQSWVAESWIVSLD